MRKGTEIRTLAPLPARVRDGRAIDTRIVMQGMSALNVVEVATAEPTAHDLEVEAVRRLTRCDYIGAGAVGAVVASRAAGRVAVKDGRAARPGSIVVDFGPGHVVWISKDDPRIAVVEKPKKSKAGATVCGFCFGPMTSPAASERCLQPQLHASAEAPAVAVVGGDFCEGPCPYCETGLGECVKVARDRFGDLADSADDVYNLPALEVKP